MQLRVSYKEYVTGLAAGFCGWSLTLIAQGGGLHSETYNRYLSYLETFFENKKKIEETDKVIAVSDVKKIILNEYHHSFFDLQKACNVVVYFT